jgi:hypothetical protein
LAEQLRQARLTAADRQPPAILTAMFAKNVLLPRMVAALEGRLNEECPLIKK